MELEDNNQKEELKEYLDDLIGCINCGRDSSENEYIKSLEELRIERSKNVITNLLNNVPKDKISYIYCKELHGICSYDEIDILDIEIVINYSILGVLNMIKNKNEAIKRHYNDSLFNFENIEYIKRVIVCSNYYERELDNLIIKTEENIKKILKTSEPTFDFFEGKKYKKEINLF